MNVTLKKPHTHAGVDHPVGARIEVTGQEAAFLVEHGVIDEPAPAKAKAGKTTSDEVSK